jgi:hypothetical protein
MSDGVLHFGDYQKNGARFAEKAVHLGAERVRIARILQLALFSQGIKE